MSMFQAPDGCRVHYEVTGEGTPVVLIPGLGGDGRAWAGVASLLARRHRLIIPDHRGAGRSDRPPSGYSLDAIARDVLGILDQEIVPKAHIVGHSTGGAIAQLMTLEAPRRVSSLVVSSSWCRVDERFRRLFTFREAVLREMGPGAYEDLTHLLGYPREWIEAHAAELATALAGAEATLSPTEVQIARIHMLLTHDVAARLPAISPPTLVIAAEDDALLPPAYSEDIARAIPHARLLMTEGGHFHLRTRPERFAEIVLGFLAGQDIEGRTT